MLNLKIPQVRNGRNSIKKVDPCFHNDPPGVYQRNVMQEVCVQNRDVLPSLKRIFQQCG